MEHTLKVAYILHRFPILSETFVLRELWWIGTHGVDVQIFSLLAPRDSVVDAQAAELLPRTRYAPLISRAVLAAQWYFLRRAPARYWNALARCVWQSYREPMVLLRVLLLFPKSVYFARLIERERIEHVHAHFAWTGAYAAAIAAELLGISYSIHTHAFDIFGRDQQAVRRQLEHSARIVTISQYNRAHIAKLCPSLASGDIDVVYCGVDSARFRPAEGAHDQQKIQLLSIGRLIAKKGHAYVIDACKLLAAQGYDFECCIIGTGPLQRALQARIERHGLGERVRLLGALSPERVLELLQRSDIFVLAAAATRGGDRDGIPVVLMEAMACGLPVVTTAVSGIPELVSADNGILVAQHDARALAGGIQRLIGDGALRARLGAAARQAVLERFEIGRNTAALAGIFRRSSHGPAALPGLPTVSVGRMQ